MYVCVCVCLFSIEIQTTGRMGMKWGFDPEPQPPRVHKGGVSRKMRGYFSANRKSSILEEIYF